MAIVVSHRGSDFEKMAKSVLRQAALADLVELRLDDLGDLEEERLAAFVKECPKPVIAAVHGREAFGTFEGTVEERLELLRMAARAGCRFVDVDWRLSLDLGWVGGVAGCGGDGDGVGRVLERGEGLVHASAGTDPGGAVHLCCASGAAGS